MSNRRFRCAKGGDCMYKIASGLCSRPPRFLAIDQGCHYGNQTLPSEQFPILVDIHDCPYRGGEVDRRVLQEEAVDA